MNVPPERWQYKSEWYRLSTSGKVLSLSVSPVAREAYLKIDWPAAPIIRGFLDGFRFDVFKPLAATCGFDDVALAKVEDGWATFAFDLEPIGREKKVDGLPSINWKRAYAVSATLNILFFFLNWCEIDMAEREPCQLIVIDSIATERRDHGSSLGAVLAPRMARWLEQKPDDWEAGPVRQTMVEVHELMSKGFQRDPGFTKWQTRVRLAHPARISLDCPGDACGLYVDGFNRYEPDRGVGLSCHNVDSPVQQLTLLTGLAALCDLYRQENGQ